MFETKNNYSLKIQSFKCLYTFIKGPTVFSH